MTKTYISYTLSIQTLINSCTKKFRMKWFDKECREARKCLMVLDVVNDKENYQKHLHEYKRLIQRNRRIREVTQQFLQTQEKAHAYAKFWGNLKGKRVESYGYLTLHDLSMHVLNVGEI